MLIGAARPAPHPLRPRLQPLPLRLLPQGRALSGGPGAAGLPRDLSGRRQPARRRSTARARRPAAAPARGTGSTALRQYRHGDDPRGIHWKQTARTGAMVYMEREAEHSRRLSILFDNGVGELADEASRSRFERLVSEAATAALDHLARGYEVELVTRDRALGFAAGARQRLAILEALALVEPAPRRSDPLLSSDPRAPQLRVHLEPEEPGARELREDGAMTFGRQKRLLLGWLALLAPIPLPFNDVVQWPLARRSTCSASLLFLRRAAAGPAALAADLGDERPGAGLPPALLPRPVRPLGRAAGAGGPPPLPVRAAGQALGAGRASGTSGRRRSASSSSSWRPWAPASIRRSCST